MTHTDEQLEPACRRLCAIRGIDPDVFVMHGHPEHPTLLTSTVQWRLLLPELCAHLEREQALMDVLYESQNDYIKGEPDHED